MNIIQSVEGNIKIGDPFWSAWVITIGYLLDACLCLAVWNSRRKLGKSGPLAVRYFWLGLAAGLLFLSINKQLDLQSLLIVTGKKIAQSEGWYEARRPVQIGFLVVLGGLALSALIGLIWALKDSWREQWAILLGLGVIVLFVFLRAMQFQHLDSLFRKWRQITPFPFSMSRAIEMTAIVIIAFGAIKAIRGGPVSRAGQKTP